MRQLVLRFTVEDSSASRTLCDSANRGLVTIEHLWLGMLIVFAAGVLKGSFTLPMMYSRTWNWENIGSVYSLAALFVFRRARHCLCAEAVASLSRSEAGRGSLSGAVRVSLGDRTDNLRSFNQCGWNGDRIRHRLRTGMRHRVIGFHSCLRSSRPVPATRSNDAFEFASALARPRVLGLNITSTSECRRLR